MNLIVLTVEEMKRLHQEMVDEIKKLFEAQQKQPKLLTGSQVCKMLGLPVGKLKSMRDKGEIEFIDFGKKFKYELMHVLEIIERKKRNKKLMCVVYCLLAPYMDVDLLCA